MQFLPLAHNSKKPLAGDDWHARISDDSGEHAEWLRSGLNLGLAIEESGRVVVDFDDKEAGRRFREKYPQLCTVVVETRRGFHFHFSGKTKTRKFANGDVKGNGYVVYPPSKVDGFPYVLLANGELQPFPEHLFVPIQATRQDVGTITRGPIQNVKAYVMKIESIQGQNGSAGLVRFVSVCRDNGVSEAQTLLWLLEWNKSANVNPPWPDEELARATTRGFTKK